MTDRAMALGEQLRQIISQTLYFEMRDPHLTGITVTRVKVSPDLQFADVRFTFPDENKSLAKVLAALERSAGVFRPVIAKEVKLRRIPNLRFHHDRDVSAERRIGEILDGLEIPPTPENDAD